MESPSNLEARYRAARSNPASVERGGSVNDAPAHSKPRVQLPRMNIGKLGKAKKWVAAAVAAVLLLWVVVIISGMLGSGIPGVDSSKYQAVFLVDGTQYVGKLTRLDASHYKLSKAYFVTASPTPVVSDEGSRQSSANQVALVKLETGLLNAENEMTIPKDKVLFYENLKRDGQAAKLLDGDK